MASASSKSSAAFRWPTARGKQQTGGKLRHQPQLDERQLQPGVVRQIDKIAVQQQGGAYADGGASDRSYDGFGKIRQGVQELQNGVIGIQAGFAHKIGQVIAGGEAIALSLYQQHMHGVILCCLA